MRGAAVARVRHAARAGARCAASIACARLRPSSLSGPREHLYLKAGAPARTTASTVAGVAMAAACARCGLARFFFVIWRFHGEPAGALRR